jgi:hypothetical protein
MQGYLSPLGCSIDYCDDVTELESLKHCALNSSLCQQRGMVGHSGKIESAAASQKTAHFFGQPLFPLHPLTICGR